MKHNIKITAILLAMFIITQFIGLFVVGHYSPVRVVSGQITNVSAPQLPYGMETPVIEKENDFYQIFSGILFAFAIAIALLFLLTKFKVAFVLKLWFFIVVMIALGISFNAIIPQFKYSSLIALLIAFPLALTKIYGRNFIIHNITELLIYPGIAAVFVPLLNVWTIIGLLILISLYDAWAVWHSGIMQKMAKYQIDHLKVFSGFLIPYVSKKVRAQIKAMKEAAKNSEFKAKQFRGKKIKAHIAVLGGGDVIFPIIAAGVMMRTAGLLSAIFVIVGAAIGLGYLFFYGEKNKFYPAMPFITAGIFAGMIAGYLIL